MSTETKLAEWARGKGIKWELARTQMIPGDIEAAAEQLKYARLLEKRAAAMQVAA